MSFFDGREAVGSQISVPGFGFPVFYLRQPQFRT